MKRHLLIVVTLLIFSQALYAVSPVQYLQLAVKDEGMIKENNRNTLMFTGLPFMLGGIAVEGSPAKDVMIIGGGINVASSIFYDFIPSAYNLKAKYDLHKDNMNDETAIKILKEEKDNIEMNRKLSAAMYFIASLFNVTLSNDPSANNDANIAIKSILIGEALDLWFNPTSHERMIGTAISGDGSAESQAIIK